MSLYGSDFIREVKERLGDCELNFTPHGKCFICTFINNCFIIVVVIFQLIRNSL